MASVFLYLWVSSTLCVQGDALAAADRAYSSGLFDRAATQYRSLLQKTPKAPELWMRLGACEYQLGRFNEAEQAFQRAQAQSPDFQPALVGLGTALIALERAGEAIRLLEKAVELAPRDRMAQRALGHAYQKTNKLFEGERLLRALVAADPKDAESWYYLGLLLYDNNYYLSSLEALDSSLALEPRNLQARTYHAGALAQLGRIEEAERAFRELLAGHPAATNPEVLLGYAQLCFNTGRLEQALVQIDKALGSIPESAKLRFWRARTLLKLQRLGEAAREAEMAVRYAPELPNARGLLLKIYQAQGRTREAKELAAWLDAFETKKRRPPR